jgi:hypothetical protein
MFAHPIRMSFPRCGSLIHNLLIFVILQKIWHTTYYFHCESLIYKKEPLSSCIFTIIFIINMVLL